MSEKDNKQELTTNEDTQERTPREIESREASQRIQSWENPSNLPTPNKADGYLGILELAF